MIYCWRAIVELRTPLHCGGGDDNGFDQPVLRDALGCYRIPGSTLAGVLRGYAEEHFPEDVTARAFGNAGAGQTDEATGLASAVWCYDAPLLDFDNRPAAEKLARGEKARIGSGPYIRDHVRIDGETGAAANSGKFDEEFTPAGTRFALAFTLDGWMQPPEPELVRLFDSLCAALEAGDIRFGGKAAGGFGHVRVLEKSCRVFDLAREEGMRAWLNLSESPLFAPHEGAEHRGAGQAAPAPRRDKGIYGELTLPLEADGPLLIGGGAALNDDDNNDVDIHFYAEPHNDYTAGEARLRRVLPGTSLRGVLRHRVRHVAESLGLAGEEICNGLFGAVSGRDGGRPGKLAIEDAVLEESRPVPVQHVAVDRFTGGALEGALYSEGVLWSGKLAVNLCLRCAGLEDREAALLLHALLDLCRGDLPVGAGGNRGNGALRLKGLEQGWAAALRGKDVHCTLRHGEDSLSAEEPHNLQNWLERLEKALPGGGI